MVEALYREIDGDDARAFEAHLAECPECAALYADMRVTAAAMDRRRRPDPGADFWDGYWERLEARIVRESPDSGASRFERRRSLGSWGYRVAAAALVLAAGVWIGRSFFVPAPTGMSPAPQQTANSAPADRAPGGGTVTPDTANDRVAAADHPRPAIDSPRESDRAGGAVTTVSVDARARRYIDQSQVVLLELLNAGANTTSGASDVGVERRRAEQLVAEAGPLRSDLTKPGDLRLRELVGQLELILREIAHLEESSDLEAVDVIRSRVNREGVLLRIDLEQMRKPAAPPADTRQKRSGDAID